MFQYNFSLGGRFPSCLDIQIPSFLPLQLLTDWVLALYFIVVNHNMATEMSAITFMLRTRRQKSGKYYSLKKLHLLFLKVSHPW